MTIHTDRIVLVFPIATKNRQAAASLQTLEITESGKEFETLIPLDPALVNQYATEFNLGFEAEKAALVAAHKTALDAKEAELTTANATIAELESDLATASNQLEAVTTAKTALQNDYDQLNAMQLESTLLITQLQAKVADLEQYRPFNPRIIDATAFYNRITKEEFASLSVSDDPTLRNIAKTILAYKTNDWPVIFESTEFQQMMGYLMFGTAPPFLSDERARELAKDATRSEAYNAD
jgi:hypothetical protein